MYVMLTGKLIGNAGNPRVPGMSHYLPYEVMRRDFCHKHSLGHKIVMNEGN